MSVDLDRVWSDLGTIDDPELGVSIVDLGLVYSVDAHDGVVHIVMTTTTPLCPLGDLIERQIRNRLGTVPGITGVDIEVVHDPPWGPHLMTDAARAHLGTAPRRATPAVEPSDGVFGFPKVVGRRH